MSNSSSGHQAPGSGHQAPDGSRDSGSSGVKPLQVLPLGGGRYQISEGSSHRVAFAVSHKGQTWVFLAGRVHLIQAEASGGNRRSGRQDDASALAAPMPATVVTVNVVPGQQVTRGEVLIVLEAMKMELAIKAPRDAIVRSVACRAGELVQSGVALVELD